MDLYEERKTERSEWTVTGTASRISSRFYEDGKPVAGAGRSELHTASRMPGAFLKDGTKDFSDHGQNYTAKAGRLFYYGQAGVKLIGGKVDQDFDAQAGQNLRTLPKEED